MRCSSATRPPPAPSKSRGECDLARIEVTTRADAGATPEDGPVSSLPKTYVHVDGKQLDDRTRELTYSEIPRS